MATAWVLCQHPSTQSFTVFFPSFLTASVPSFSPHINYEFPLLSGYRKAQLRSQQKLAKEKYAQLQRFGRCKHMHCLGIYWDKAHIQALMYLLSHQAWKKKSRQHQFTLHLVSAVISPVCYTVLCSAYSGHTEKSGQMNSIKRLKLNLLLSLLYLAIGTDQAYAIAHPHVGGVCNSKHITFFLLWSSRVILFLL